jgi:Kelch motif/Galactose oxidase, central domain
MNENELERSLRSWHRATIDPNERAPIELRTSLVAISQVAAPQARFFDRPRFGLLAAALLAALLLGGAIGLGSGLIRLPSLLIVIPSPTETLRETPSAAPRLPTWTGAAFMVSARTWHTATLLADGRVLVAGGQSTGSQDSALSSAEIYDPSTRTWTSTANMSTPRTGHTATRLADGRVLVAGGNSWLPTPGDLVQQGPHAVSLNSAELYDPASATWSTTGSMHAPYSLAAAVLLSDGRVLMVAGGNAELYDAATGTWVVTASMITPRDGEVLALLQDGRVLAAGGFDGTGNNPDEYVTASAEIYDPVTGTWSATGSMTAPRDRAAASLLPDGRVLVSGGWNPYSTPREYPTTAEIFDPATGRWTTTGSISTPRYDFSSTRLANGDVLIAGGIDLSSSPGFGYDVALVSCELYNPAAQTWSDTASMINARAFQTATLLNDGTVLLVGGQSSASAALSSAELFDPGNQ